MKSENQIPMIPKGRPISWKDWFKGRKARRDLGNRVAPEVIRRESGAHDKRLRELFQGEQGMPFRSLDEL